MQIFPKPKPEKQLADKLATKTAERDKLANRLAEATATVSAAAATVTRLAVGGADDAALDQAETRLRALSDRVTTLRSALAEAEATVVTLTHELASLRDILQRASTAVEIETIANDLNQLVLLSDELFSKMALTAGRAATANVWDASGLRDYAINSRTQIPDAINVTVASLHYHRDRVLDGSARAVLYKPDQPVIETFVEPKVTRVFATTNICWTDHKGHVQTSGKYNDTDLPPAIAARALASGICRTIGSDVWKDFSGTQALCKPPVSECKNLDEDGADAGALAINTDTPSNAKSTKLDRGPVIEFRIPKEGLS